MKIFAQIWILALGDCRKFWHVAVLGPKGNVKKKRYLTWSLQNTCLLICLSISRNHADRISIVGEHIVLMIFGTILK
jgi:hypothetical protein